MDALVLGTGSADGWPNPFCGCASCTAERAAGRVRGQTAVLVDGRLLLDCGPETPRAAERAGVDLTRLRHVLVTHAHPDHCAPAFLLFRSWVGDTPLDVVGPPAVLDQARMWVAPDSPVRFVPVAPGDRLSLGEYDVRVLDARHDGDAVLYDVGTTDARLLYATDTGPFSEDTIRAVAGAAYSLVLLEQTFGDWTTHGIDHLDLTTFPEQVRRLREAGALTEDTDLVAVHLSHHNPPTPELDRRLADWGARTVTDGALLHVRRAASSDASSAGRSAAPGSSAAPAAAASGRTAIRRTLVIGGARSGKSREAERLLAAEPEVTYVATSYPVAPDAPADGPGAVGTGAVGSGAGDPGSASSDAEWAERVRAHRARRPTHWRTLETLDLVPLLAEPGEPLLVDCLTLWLTRVMDGHEAWDDETWRATAEKAVTAEIDALVAAWRGTGRRVVAVTNEVGQGVVPDTAAGRRFRDLMGRLNARLAAETEDVRWCVAGRVASL